MYTVLETKFYKDWLKQQSKRDQAQIQTRIIRICIDEHFGFAKRLNEKLAELKWKNGRRVYFSVLSTEKKTIVLLVGGNKNSQSKDIRKAMSILREIEVEKQ